jgi:hypothetical protein
MKLSTLILWNKGIRKSSLRARKDDDEIDYRTNVNIRVYDTIVIGS